MKFHTHRIFRQYLWVFTKAGWHFLVIVRRLPVAGKNTTLDCADMEPNCASHLSFTQVLSDTLFGVSQSGALSLEH